MKRLFISKSESEIQAHIPTLEGLGFQLHCASFLAFLPVYSPVQKPFEVLFFSSPRSVIFYFSQYPLPTGTLLACAGAHTAEILASMGHRADFIGEKSGDMHTVGQAFKHWCGERTVLFPVSARSLGTVSTLFDDRQKEVLTVYDTQLRTTHVAECTHYAFTSPSNVEGFFLDHKLPEDAIVIAWGKSTASALAKAGIRAHTVLAHGSMRELIEKLAEA